jgi:hypothetical protein
MSTMASDGRPATADQILDDAMVALDHQYSGDPASRANMLLVIAALYSDSRNVEKASDALLKAETIAVKLGNSSLTAQAECNLATMQDIMGGPQARARASGSCPANGSERQGCRHVYGCGFHRPGRPRQAAGGDRYP